MAAHSSEEFPASFHGFLGGLPDTFERPAALCGHNLEFLTERLPHTKGAKGLVFSVCFTFPLFCGLGDTKNWCTILGHHVLVPAPMGDTHKETQRERTSSVF